jgi:hypothetical protein
MASFFYSEKRKTLPFKKYFYHKQNHDKKDKTNQNLVISFVKSFMQLRIFSIGIYHCDNKSNKKTAGKQQLSLTKHNLKYFGQI